MQREVWFSRGPLFDAIRASIAIPTIFRPYHYEGRLLVDGGLLNPLPVSPTLRDLTDSTIAVDINAPAEPLYATPGVRETGRSADRGAAGQASPEMLPDGGKPAPIDIQRAGYRRRIARIRRIDEGEARTDRRGQRARRVRTVRAFARTVQETITRFDSPRSRRIY